MSIFTLPKPKCPSCGHEFDENGACPLCKRCAWCCRCLAPEKLMDDISGESLAANREKYRELREGE